MASPESTGPARGTGDPSSDDDLASFFDVLNELKSTGCNLLVVGDAPRELFARASARMLGDDDATRYRVLAATDATPGSVADRLPDPAESPRPVGETTHLLNHVGAVRSVTAPSESPARPELAGVRETRVADPQLNGLQCALVEAIDDFAARAGDSLEPGALRVGVDSLAPLVDFYGEDVVRRCLRIVGGHVRNRDAMAHYVLPEPYDSELVRAFADDADAVVEIRLADVAGDDRVGEQRWHVPNRELSVGWTPL